MVAVEKLGGLSKPCKDLGNSIPGRGTNGKHKGPQATGLGASTEQKEVPHE